MGAVSQGEVGTNTCNLI